MKELGAYLKRTRISNGVNIAEAAEDLELSVAELENIESGNAKAFRDVYVLREDVKQYSKYLGLNPDKVMDTFNTFLFQHTTKLSLDDIMAAAKQKKEEFKEKRKVQSPYTKEFKKKSYAVPVFFVGVLAILLIFLIIYIVVTATTKTPIRTDELSSIGRENITYEFTY